VQHEEMSAGRWFGFGIVWLALVVLTADSFAAARASRRRALAPTPAEPV
jgi:chloramphenicol-sensitive protein RarD